MNAAVVVGLEEGRMLPRVVRRLMTHYGVTGNQLAAAFGISRQAISYRLTGRTAIHHAEVKGLARFFGVPTEVLYLNPDEALLWVLQHPEDRPQWLSEQGVEHSRWNAIFRGYESAESGPVLSVA